MSVGYKLISIQELASSYEPLTEELTKVTSKDISVNVGCRFKLDSKAHLFYLNVEFELRCEKIDIDKPIIQLESETVFGLSGDYEKYVTNVDGGVEFDEHFFTSLVSLFVNIAIGATRGLVASTTRGTWLSKFPMPLMDHGDFMRYLRSNEDGELVVKKPIKSNAKGKTFGKKSMVKKRG